MDSTSDRFLAALSQTEDELIYVSDQLAAVGKRLGIISSTVEEANQCSGYTSAIEEHLKYLSGKLSQEHDRLRDLRFYWRAAQEVCSNAGITLPAYISEGMYRCCRSTYRPKKTYKPFDPPSDEDPDDVFNEMDLDEEIEAENQLVYMDDPYFAGRRHHEE